MTEIPEHLLKRSKQAKSKATGEELPADEAGAGDAPAEASSSAPATQAAAAPALAAQPPETTAAPPFVPDSPPVAAFKSRKRPPAFMWPVLGFLPVWAVIYWSMLDVREAEAEGPLALGNTIYTSAGCTACHGADGGGGVGPQLSGGEVLLTFPSIDDQIEFVRNGSVAGEAYGDPGRAGGQRVGSGGMPQFGSLSDEELLAVICHERITLSGGEDEACTAEAGAAGEGGDHSG